ncbi:hypothetical protein [Methyloprofundus sp.]|uniref:hypothetical protein n=1 Tax=Methyloprofundus sp. TaxID=2020875 RepID=UPI003D15248A
MYLVNDIRWQRTPLLSFFSQIKASQPFSDIKNGQHKFFDVHCSLAHPVICIFNLIFTSKAAHQGAHKTTNSKITSPIFLEISTEKINELLQNKQICAADIRCLDSDSKHCLMKLCLENYLTGK